MKYGLISELDGGTLEKTIDLICNEFTDKLLDITEIGVYAGGTGDGIRQYVESKGRQVFKTGIDNDKDQEPIRYHYHKLIIGDSNEVYNQLEDDSQHLIFIDGCHCFAHVISDFFCYSPKVKIGGYIAFHDTGKHIKPFKDFQHGDKDNPDAYISVRKALSEMGLLNQWKRDPDSWELVFDEADENNEAGGICVFKKLL